jgi:hypothetical protein
MDLFIDYKRESKEADLLKFRLAVDFDEFSDEFRVLINRGESSLKIFDNIITKV